MIGFDTVIALAVRYWYLLVIGALLLLVQDYREDVLVLERDIAQHEKAVSDMNAERERVALEHAQAIVKLKDEHALQQNQLEKTYVEALDNLKAQRADDRAAIDRMRLDIKKYAGSDSVRGLPLDAAAANRAADRLDTLGGLLAEGVELVVEGRGIVQRRDLEVKRLVDQIKTDRQACDEAGRVKPR